MSELGTVGALGVLVTLLAGVTHEVAEQLFGGFVSGKLMYWCVLATGVAIAFGAQAVAAYVPALDPLKGLPWQVVLAGGLITGFSATKLHGVLTHDEGTKDASLSALATNAFRAIGKSDGDMSLAVELRDLMDAYSAGNITVDEVKKRAAALQIKYPGYPGLPAGWPAS